VFAGGGGKFPNIGNGWISWVGLAGIWNRRPEECGSTAADHAYAANDVATLHRHAVVGRCPAPAAACEVTMDGRINTPNALFGDAAAPRTHNDRPAVRRSTHSYNRLSIGVHFCIAKEVSL